MRVRQALLGAVAAAVVLVAVLDVAEVVHIGQAGGGPVNVLPSSQSTMLYDIPNFVYQRTQMHFPQAEENWLNMAAEGKIGDDVKPEKILTNLNGIISDARTHALTENYAARVQAKKDALEENYDVYDVHKGKVVHKIYGKQVGGSMTLKPVGEQGQMLAQRDHWLEDVTRNFEIVMENNRAFSGSKSAWAVKWRSFGCPFSWEIKNIP